ncbi:hypothetical protein ACFL11_00900 [Patescibacteria group bacterium]
MPAIFGEWLFPAFLFLYIAGAVGFIAFDRDVVGEFLQNFFSGRKEEYRNTTMFFFFLRAIFWPFWAAHQGTLKLIGFFLSARDFFLNHKDKSMWERIGYSPRIE